MALPSARTVVLVSGAVGLAVGVGLAFATRLSLATLAGWDAAAAVYLLWIWLTIWPMDAGRTARLAGRADPTRGEADLLLLGASVISLISVAFVLASAAHVSAGARDLRLALGLSSVVLSWGVVHTVFTLRYARLYYLDTHGDVNFNSPEPPAYTDFAYLGFTVGMTFQVADTDLCTRDMRTTVLRHELLSYLFGTGILATTVNLVATLSSQ